MRCVFIVSCWLSWFSVSGQATDFANVDFSKADSVALSLKGHDLHHPDALADKLVEGLTTDVEKFRSIYRWIADNIAYDYPQFQRIVKKEKQLRLKRKKLKSFSERASKHVYRSMIRREKTICSGFSTLLEYMCEHVGITCQYVSGYGRTFALSGIRGPNHAWNAVKLGNRWYLCDVTWACQWIVMGNQRFRRTADDTYFLTEPSLFIANHYPTDKSWTLLKDGPSLQHFLSAPFKDDGFINNWINQYAPDKQSQRVALAEDFEVRFTCNAQEVSPEARLQIADANRRDISTSINCQLGRDKTGEYIISHRFDKRGRFWVYVYVNSELTLVYQVWVI